MQYQTAITLVLQQNLMRLRSMIFAFRPQVKNLLQKKTRHLENDLRRLLRMWMINRLKKPKLKTVIILFVSAEKENVRISSQNSLTFFFFSSQK